MVTVRLGKEDVSILYKDSNQGEWTDAVLPNDLPSWANNVFWEGLTKTKVLKDIKDFSPIKGDLPSTAEMMKKRKERTPDGKEDRRSKV